VTRWAKWYWQAVAVLPGAAPADWQELRRDGDCVEFHAATVDLVLWRSEAEAYLSGLSTRIPSIYIVLREASQKNAKQELDVLLATASPYEAQDYADSSDEMVEKVPMPEALVAWVRDFVKIHYQDEVFIKRRRDKLHVDKKEDGIGDARVQQLTDVYRAPTNPKTDIIQ